MQGGRKPKMPRRLRADPMQDRSLPSAEIRRPLIPQYSLRWLLMVTTGVAVIFSVVGLGLRGHKWAAAVSIGLSSLVVVVLVYGLGFAVVWGFSVITSTFRRGKAGAGTSPFRSEPPDGGRQGHDKEAAATPIVLD